MGIPSLLLDLSSGYTGMSPTDLAVAQYIGHASPQLLEADGVGGGVSGDGGHFGGVLLCPLFCPLTLQNPGVNGFTSNVLVFSYTVRPTDGTPSLDYQSTAALINSNGPSDGIFRVRNISIPQGIDFPLAVRAVLTLPPKGSKNSLGRTTDIVISNNNKPYVTAVTANLAVVTAGDVLYVGFVFSADMTLVDENDSSMLVTSEGYLVPAAATLDISLSLTIIPNITTSTSTITAALKSVIGNTVTFCYTVLASNPSGAIQIRESNPFIFPHSSLVSLSLSNREIANCELKPSQLGTVSTVDNTVPYVISVRSKSGPGFYPYSVGDRITIIILFSAPVAVSYSRQITPYLRLLLDNGVTVNIPSNPLNSSHGTVLIEFEYIVQIGEHAHPLQYDGIFSLSGDIVRYSPLHSHPNPHSPLGVEDVNLMANLTLPSPLSLSPSPSLSSLSLSLGAENIQIDTTPPHVQFLMPVRTSGVYGAGEVIPVLVRFTRPVYTVGTPHLLLQTGSNRVGVAVYVRDFQAYELLIDVGETDLVFEYVVSTDDDTPYVTHTSPHAIILNGGAIFTKSLSPSQPVDLLLRTPTDKRVSGGIVDRQWMDQFPAKIELLLRDLYHTNPSSLKISVEHSGQISELFSMEHSLRGKTFGHSYPHSVLNNNYTARNIDTGIGGNFFFSDTLLPNIARK